MTRKTRIIWLISFFIVTIVLWNFPFGYYVLYPFTILGTWFHEMAHGLTALLLGADFNRLQLYPNGSGVAQFSYSSLFLGRLGSAIIAGAGPIGPTIAGVLFLLSSLNQKATKIILIILSIFLLISFLIWVRPLFSIGAFIVLLFAVLTAVIAIKSKAEVQELSVQFLGVQSFASVYMSIGYLFSAGGDILGSSFSSDTQVIADNLLLPYWFWAILLLSFSAYMLYLSLKKIIKKA